MKTGWAGGYIWFVFFLSKQEETADRSLLLFAICIYKVIHSGMHGILFYLVSSLSIFGTSKYCMSNVQNLQHSSGLQSKSLCCYKVHFHKNPRRVQGITRGSLCLICSFPSEFQTKCYKLFGLKLFSQHGFPKALQNQSSARVPVSHDCSKSQKRRFVHKTESSSSPV